MNKKLTDSEIVKALECCIKCNDKQIASCGGCILEEHYPWCDEEIEKFALDLINRLQEKNSNLQEKNLNLTSDLTSLQNDLTSLKAENERLKEEVKKQQGKVKIRELIINKLKTGSNAYIDLMSDSLGYLEIKAEAYKEFAERLKEMSEHFDLEKENFVSEETIDNLLKEMVGD